MVAPACKHIGTRSSLSEGVTDKEVQYCYLKLIKHTINSSLLHFVQIHLGALTVHLFYKQLTSLNMKQAFKLLSTHHQNLE